MISTLPAISSLSNCQTPVAVLIGPFLTVSAVWTLADIFNGLMAIPNLIALVALNGVIVAETRSYFKRLDSGRIQD